MLERQHGRVARRQLLAAGLSEDQVDWRVKRGRLWRVYQGVYAVAGAPATREAIWMAAVLAGGEGAALSHRSAAELWGVLPGCSSPVHVTVPGSAGRAKRAGLAMHRAAAGSVVHRGIPVTEPWRTLRDLRGRQRERAASEAQRLGLISADDAALLLRDGAPATNRLER